MAAVVVVGLPVCEEFNNLADRCIPGDEQWRLGGHEIGPECVSNSVPGSVGGEAVVVGPRLAGHDVRCMTRQSIAEEFWMIGRPSSLGHRVGGLIRMSTNLERECHVGRVDRRYVQRHRSLVTWFVIEEGVKWVCR